MNCIKKVALVAFLSTCLIGCNNSANQGGLNSLVDRIKSFFGMQPQTTIDDERLAANPPLPQTQETNKKPQEQTSNIDKREDALSLNSEKILNEIDKVASSPAHGIAHKDSFEERVKNYRNFEEELLIIEEDKIKLIEDDTSVRIDQIMSDERVMELTKKNPNITFEELPEDIYNKIVDISNEQEKLINDTMDDTDQKLKEMAKELNIEDHINELDESERAERKKQISERTSTDPKAKIAGEDATPSAVTHTAVHTADNK